MLAHQETEFLIPMSHICSEYLLELIFPLELFRNVLGMIAYKQVGSGALLVIEYEEAATFSDELIK